MEPGLKSLWGSLKAFFGFWVAFVCATIFNTLLPCDSLKNNFLFQYFVTDGMVELRRKIVRLVTYGGPTRVLDAAVVMFQNATYNFLGYFKEIFVIVTFMHFTPLLEGLEIHFMIPRWLKRFLRRFGYNLTPKQEQENDDFYAQYEDPDEPESPSDPPPLEDMSHLLGVESVENVAGMDSGVGKEGVGGGVSGVGNEVGVSSGVGVGGGVDDSPSSGSFGSAGTTPSTANACSSISQDSQTLPTQPEAPSVPTKPETISRQSSQSKVKERYVYDPVYGVILQETRDLWHAQEEDSQHRKKALLDAFLSAEKSIPPVRFSTREMVN